MFVHLANNFNLTNATNHQMKIATAEVKNIAAKFLFFLFFLLENMIFDCNHCTFHHIVYGKIHLLTYFDHLILYWVRYYILVTMKMFIFFGNPFWIMIKSSLERRKQKRIEKWKSVFISTHLLNG